MDGIRTIFPSTTESSCRTNAPQGCVCAAVTEEETTFPLSRKRSLHLQGKKGTFSLFKWNPLIVFPSKLLEEKHHKMCNFSWICLKVFMLEIRKARFLHGNAESWRFCLCSTREEETSISPFAALEILPWRSENLKLPSTENEPSITSPENLAEGILSLPKRMGFQCPVAAHFCGKGPLYKRTQRHYTNVPYKRKQ